jgi:hypothetical protein
METISLKRNLQTWDIFRKITVRAKGGRERKRGILDFIETDFADQTELIFEEFRLLGCGAV